MTCPASGSRFGGHDFRKVGTVWVCRYCPAVRTKIGARQPKITLAPKRVETTWR